MVHNEEQHTYYELLRIVLTIDKVEVESFVRGELKGGRYVVVESLRLCVVRDIAWHCRSVHH